jgi:hypothetical protein
METAIPETKIAQNDQTEVDQAKTEENQQNEQTQAEQTTVEENQQKKEVEPQAEE